MISIINKKLCTQKITLYTSCSNFVLFKPVRRCHTHVNVVKTKQLPLPVSPLSQHVPSCLAHLGGLVLEGSSLPSQGASSYQTGPPLAQESGPLCQTNTKQY